MDKDTLIGAADDETGSYTRSDQPTEMDIVSGENDKDLVSVVSESTLESASSSDETLPDQRAPASTEAVPDIQTKLSDDESETPVVVDDVAEFVPSEVLCLFHFESNAFKVTEARAEFQSERLVNNFTKGCKWAPDGLCALTNSDDNCLRIFNLPEVLFQADWSNPEDMRSVVKVSEPSTVYDFGWYPLMNSGDPSTCLFASTTAGNPVHMWDAFTGALRCSYRAYNHLDEIVGANSIAFDSQGTKLYCGYDKFVRIFDVSNPGRDCDSRPLKAKGHVGIISCIAVSPADSDLYAVGSYLKTIGLYTEPKGKQLFLLQGHTGGITHLKFSPDGQKLYSGGRKDSEILCWDLRSPGKVLFAMERRVSTNQRIYFDVDESDTYLISGNTNGFVSVWDLTKPVQAPSSDEGEPILDCVHTFHAHGDCTNGVSFNPRYPVILTSGGGRKFPELVESEAEDEIFKDMNDYDNSLSLWWIGGDRFNSVVN